MTDQREQEMCSCDAIGGNAGCTKHNPRLSIRRERGKEEQVIINLVLSNPPDSPFPRTWLAQLIEPAPMRLGYGVTPWDAVFDLLRRVSA